MKNTIMNNKVTTIKNKLKQLSNKQLAEHSQKYFKTAKGEYGEGDKFLGIHVPLLRKLAREYKEISIKEELLLYQHFILLNKMISGMR
jgi:hypothetical protein